MLRYVALKLYTILYSIVLRIERNGSLLCSSSISFGGRLGLSHEGELMGGTHPVVFDALQAVLNLALLQSRGQHLPDLLPPGAVQIDPFCSLGILLNTAMALTKVQSTPWVKLVNIF